MRDLNRTPQELVEIFDWYSQWILTECTRPHSEIFWLCDNSKHDVIKDIIELYRLNNK